MEEIRRHTDLRVFKLSFEAGMEVFDLSKKFPREETYSLTDQIRRSSRSVSGNIAEAWRKRRYTKSFIAKLTDAEGEAAETQVWLQYAQRCNYIEQSQAEALNDKYEHIIAMLINIITRPEQWTFRK